VKITETETIKNGEGEFVESLAGELDWSIIETLLKERFNLELHDDVEYHNGDFVIHENKVAYKLNFDVRLTLSLVFGRDGECLDVIASGTEDNEDD